MQRGNGSPVCSLSFHCKFCVLCSLHRISISKHVVFLAPFCFAFRCVVEAKDLSFLHHHPKDRPWGPPCRSVCPLLLKHPTTQSLVREPAASSLAVGNFCPPGSYETSLLLLPPPHNFPSHGFLSAECNELNRFLSARNPRWLACVAIVSPNDF